VDGEEPLVEPPKQALPETTVSKLQAADLPRATPKNQKLNKFGSSQQKLRYRQANQILKSISAAVNLSSPGQICWYMEYWRRAIYAR